jgi:hypothetical protein
VKHRGGPPSKGKGLEGSIAARNVVTIGSWCSLKAGDDVQVPNIWMRIGNWATDVVRGFPLYYCYCRHGIGLAVVAGVAPSKEGWTSPVRGTTDIYTVITRSNLCQLDDFGHPFLDPLFHTPYT